MNPDELKVLADELYEARENFRAKEKALMKELAYGESVATNVAVFIKERAYYDQIAIHKL